jgi:hypothetical protein
MEMMRFCLAARIVRFLNTSARCISLAIAVCAAHSADAQVYEIRGGTSSLYQASGASLNVTTTGTVLVIGAGMYAGHFESGARLERNLRGGLLVAGDDHVDFRLPTDVFDGAHYLSSRGVSFKTRINGVSALMFGGVDAANVSNPLFPSASIGAPLGFLSLHGYMTPRWQIFSDTVISKKQSEIIAVQWAPLDKTHLALSGGIGSNQFYGAASLSIKRNWLDLKSSYVDAGKEFHRFALSDPTLSEPIKGNLSCTVLPTRFLALNFGVQNYLIPLNSSGQNATSASEETGATVHFLNSDLAGALYLSKYQGNIDRAGSAVFQHPIGRRVHLMSSWTASRPEGANGSGSWTNTVEETLSARMTVNESVQMSNGSPTAYFGGSVQSNPISFSANYETFYVPTKSDPFENALMLDVRIRLLGRYTLHGQTNLSPTGRVLYSAEAYAVASGSEAQERMGPEHPLGRSILRVQAIDTTGLPVEGAAIMIDRNVSYTDSTGTLFLREHKPQSHSLIVDVDQFLSYGKYEVVSAPQLVSSSTKEDSPAAIVVVRHVSALLSESSDSPQK